jgi:heme-degrading monooxygenase HmoA
LDFYSEIFKFIGKDVKMIIQIIRFKTRLSYDEVNQRFNERADQYRKVPGLIQKYYVKFDEGEYGGVYVWNSKESLNAWRNTNLSSTVAATYEVEGEPSRQLAEVMLALNKD